MADFAALAGAGSRWAGFIAMLVVVGACVFRTGVLRSLRQVPGTDLPMAPRFAANVGAGAAAVLALAAAVRLYAQARSFAEPGERVTIELLRTVLEETAWGRGWRAQFLAAGLTFAGFVATRRLPVFGWFMAVLGTSAVVLAAPLTGHAIAAERAGAWGYPLDALHVLGAASWLGTLLVVMTAGFAATLDLEPGPRELRMAAMVNAFTPVALTGAGTAVLAGLALAFRYLGGSFPALWTSGYGRTLLLKLGLLAVVMGFGAYNWRVQGPRLGDPATAARIRRSSLLELTLGTILLAVTAWLVSMPLPGEE
jgi:putative copper export protein